MDKDQIIAIIFGSKKFFFKASLISIRDASTQSTSELEEIPDGKVKEYYADLCMEKIYKDGKLKNSLTLTGRTERSSTRSLFAGPNEKEQAIPATQEGKTFIRNIRQRIFFVNGKQTALQELNEAGEVIASQGEAFSGEAKEFYSNGSVKIEAYFQDGIPQGTVKTYDKQGRLIALEEYKNGVKEGKAKRFNFIHNIPTEEEMFYKGGILNGTRKIFSPSGKLLMSEEYKDGKRHGKIELFNSEGVIEVKAFYKGGKKHGKRIFYYETGTPMHEENFHEGLLEGERKTFAKNGALLIVENYKNNLLCGEKIHYGENGKPVKIEIYEDGKLLREENK